MAFIYVLLRKFSSSLKSIRNVGIIAHIDAGKTTTTERILFNSGKIKAVGEVDSGTTMTDYLDQERERGISITSAVATIKWKEHDINLIDTPGHIDFNLEVERSLAILDGAVTILHSVKGVEAQTQTVWGQAKTHQIPNIFFINKFDIKNANLKVCIKSIKQKLSNVVPLLIHLPYYCNKTSQFIGIMDIIDLKLEYWNVANKLHKDILVESFSRKINDSEEMFKVCLAERERLLADLIDLDDGALREEVLTCDNPALIIPPKLIHDALKRVTISATASPVLIGSSKMNIGVKNILDKIVTYLPNPMEKKVNNKFASLAAHHDHVTALVFKVTHDKYWGPMTFLRIYSGLIRPEHLLRNLTRSVEEKIDKIIQITGDNFTELESSSSGHIVAVTGLKNCYTGDLLIDWKIQQDQDDDTFSDLINIPTPVIYASIEPPTLSELKKLEIALMELSKEDPSLKFQRNEKTQQLIIGGMGKLHLEIIFDRIVNDYKLSNTRLGKVKIAYKESPRFDDDNSCIFHDHTTCEKINGITMKLTMSLSATAHEDFNAKSTVEFSNSRDFRWGEIDIQIVKLFRDSINNAINNGGSLLHSPVTGLKLTVHNFITEPHNMVLSNKSTRLVLNSFAMETARGLLKKIKTYLLEPMMKVEIIFNNPGSFRTYSSTVLNDMHKRRSHVIFRHTDEKDDDSVVAFMPLAETDDYSNSLRSMTSGNASINMSYSHYDKMSEETQEILTKRTFYHTV